MTRSFYRISAGKGAKYLDEALTGGYAGVGWLATIDLSPHQTEDWRDFNAAMIPNVKEIDSATNNISAGLAAGQTWTVCFGISEGDIVLMPDGQGTYRVGEVMGPYQYVPGDIHPHQRPVNWMTVSISRKALSHELQSSLGSALTVVSVRDDAYIAELENHLQGHGGPVVKVSDPDIEDAAAFVFEKHLEDFLVHNWDLTELGKDYEIYRDEHGELVGQQFPTDTGPLDVLARKRDDSELLVVELKRGKASDAVVGQTLRYMSYVAEMAEGRQVRGVIIATEEDLKLRRALSQIPTISFMRYEVRFQLKSD